MKDLLDKLVKKNIAETKKSFFPPILVFYYIVLFILSHFIHLNKNFSG